MLRNGRLFHVVVSALRTLRGWRLSLWPAYPHEGIN